jgi:hypothetical protein
VALRKKMFSSIRGDGDGNLQIAQKISITFSAEVENFDVLYSQQENDHETILWWCGIVFYKRYLILIYQIRLEMSEKRTFYDVFGRFGVFFRGNFIK